MNEKLDENDERNAERPPEQNELAALNDKIETPPSSSSSRLLAEALDGRR